MMYWCSGSLASHRVPCEDSVHTDAQPDLSLRWAHMQSYKCISNIVAGSNTNTAYLK